VKTKSVNLGVEPNLCADLRTGHKEKKLRKKRKKTKEVWIEMRLVKVDTGSSSPRDVNIEKSAREIAQQLRTLSL